MQARKQSSFITFPVEVVSNKPSHRTEETACRNERTLIKKVKLTYLLLTCLHISCVFYVIELENLTTTSTLPRIFSFANHSYFVQNITLSDASYYCALGQHWNLQYTQYSSVFQSFVTAARTEAIHFRYLPTKFSPVN